MSRNYYILLSVMAAVHTCHVATGSEAPGLTLGLDLTLEASTELGNGNQRNQALQGLGLGYAVWNQAAQDTQGLRYSAYGSALTLAGRGPTERYLGDFLAASSIEGYASTRLYTWWLEAKSHDWSLRGGALLADEEFAGTEGGGNFFNSAFGWPSFISANTINVGPAYNVPALGLRLEYDWGRNGTWRIGVFDGDTFDSFTGDPRVNRHGLHYHLGGDQGWFGITEAVFAPQNNPARLKLGFWMHSASFSDVRDDVNGQPFAITNATPRAYSSNYGMFAAIERTWNATNDQTGDTEAFLRVGISPADRNAIAWALDAGLSRTGLLPSRPSDILSFGVVHAAFSSRYASNIRAENPGYPAPDYEQVVEVNYTMIFSEQWSLQPDLQYIRHPGGSSSQPSALVFICRVNLSF